MRIIAATNKPLEQAIKEGKFREDLYYRLKVITIYVPPLREHKEDIPELVLHFLSKEGKKSTSIIEQAMVKLQNYSWPGNIRELENTIQRALIFSKGKVITDAHILFDTEYVPRDMELEDSNPALQIDELGLQLKPHLDALFRYIVTQSGQHVYSELFSIIEEFLIKRTLQETNGNQVQAAKLLGLSRNTLRNRILRYRIELPHSGDLI